MALTGALTLGGVQLRRPSTRRRAPEAVRSEVQLAGGGIRRYSRGNRLVWDLSWRNLPEAEAMALESVASLSSPLSFVDQDGKSYTVLVTGYDGLEAVPGTAPTRYDSSVTLATQATVR